MGNETDKSLVAEPTREIEESEQYEKALRQTHLELERRLEERIVELRRANDQLEQEGWPKRSALSKSLSR